MPEEQQVECGAATGPVPRAAFKAVRVAQPAARRFDSFAAPLSTGSDSRQARLRALASADRVASDIARAERLAAIGRGDVGRVLFDVRTPADEELDPTAAAVRTALP